MFYRLISLCWICPFPQNIGQILQQAGPGLAASGSHTTPPTKENKGKFDAENNSLY